MITNLITHHHQSKTLISSCPRVEQQHLIACVLREVFGEAVQILPFRFTLIALLPACEYLVPGHAERVETLPARLLVSKLL